LTVSASPGPSFIAIDNLSKEYPNRHRVIHDLSFTAAAGEFVSVVGASGCGKSTLLKLIAGLSPVSGGSIRIDGMSPTDARALMSFVFQDPTLLPWRNVARNVELTLELEGVGAAEGGASARKSFWNKPQAAVERPSGRTQAASKDRSAGMGEAI